MKIAAAAFALLTLSRPLQVPADPLPGSTDMHWDPGAENCAAQPHAPLEVHAYDKNTWILRENLCSTWEAPFLYLLVGSQKALLIDTGDVADPKLMPLAVTVLGLLPNAGNARLPLLVVHSHTHLDHRAGDPQFTGLPGVQLVPAQLKDVKKFFGFDQWPEGQAQIDLGGRMVDVLPAPGHNPAHVVYYDRNTGLLLTGDFLMPARLLVDDYAAYEASAERVAAFVKDRPVTHVLGGHVEKNAVGQLFDWQSTTHPDEHALPLGKQDVLGLPAALAKFNGFYTETGDYVVMNPMHNLEAFGAAAVLLLGGLGYLIVRFIRKRRAARRAKASA
ncbi:MAG: MBL fold metallo-hydrolase [Bacillota bacterium]